MDRVARASISRRSLVGGVAAGAGVAALASRRGVRAQDSVELRWSMWAASEAEIEVWEDLANDVNLAHPNITVNLETVSFNDYWDRLQTQLASQTEADIVAMQSLRMPVFAVRNALRPLQPLIDEDPDVNAEDFFDPIQQGLSYGDEVYAFAYDLGPIMLFYNIDLFEEKGVPLPSSTEPMSWEEFRDISLALSDPDEREHGYVFQPAFTAAVPWIWSGGGDYMNEDESESTLDSPESLASLQMIVDMIQDGSAALVTDLANPNYARETFSSGRIGMHQDGPWQFVNLRRDADFRWDVAPLPAGPGGSMTWVAGSGFGISNTTDHPDEAWQALKVITSSESLQKLARAGRGYPARQSAVPAFIDPEVGPENVDVVERILTGESGDSRFFRTTTTWQETEIMLQQEFNPLFLGNDSAEEIVSRVKPRFDELLANHQRLRDR